MIGVLQAKVTEMDFAGNKFDGEIPSTFAKIPSLKKLRLSGNAFTGAVPYQYCDSVASLQDMELLGNKLTCFPKCLSTVKRLVVESSIEYC